RNVELELSRVRKDACAIGVAVHHGVITLTGTVPCWKDKHAIEQAAFEVPGVRDIANEIAIKTCWNETISDSEIAEAARAALREAPVTHQQVHVTVSDQGDVTLSGAVLTADERTEAEKAIRRLAGVRYITNDLAVIASE
ncbi:MAG TPA: BON domain-containing protein, partial [Kofleriaceae bacterium]